MGELGLSIDERRRLLEANAAAAVFFRRELLRATGGWPGEYLKAHGVESVLAAGSPWRLGYAPQSWTGLADHLQEQGFGFGTLVRAGLITWTDGGEAVDRHRDQLMVVARDHRLAAVGFVGIGPDGEARSASPVTAIHRPAGVLVGIEEQRDLLRGGAVPVLVDRPVDAIAVSIAGREAGGLWAGIALGGGGLSTSQARTLNDYSASDTVVVARRGGSADRNQVQDLSFFFDRVRGVEVPSGASLAGLAKESGTARLDDVLRNARSLVSYRSTGRGFVALHSADLEPPPPGPGF